MTGLTSLQRQRIYFLCDRKKLDSNHGPRLPMSAAWLHAYKQKYEHLPSTHLEARTKLVCSKVGHAHHHSQQDKNNVNWERWGAGRKNDKQFNTLPAPAPRWPPASQRKVEAISVWMGTASVESRSEQWGKKPDKKHYNLQLTLNEWRRWAVDIIYTDYQNFLTF